MSSATVRLFPTAAAIWRGQISLGRAVWLYGFVGALGLAIPMNFASAFGIVPQNPLWIAYAVGLVGYACFVCVGIWRAAGRHEGARTLPNLARFTVVLVWLIIGASFAYGLYLGLASSDGGVCYGDPDLVLEID